MVDEFQRLGFKHETKKLLVRFHFQDDGLSIEAFLKKDFIGWKLLEARVAKDESVVHIADVFDEEMMVGKELVEVDGPNLSTDGNNHEALMRQKAGESGLPIGLPLRCQMQRWPRAKVCISSAV